MVKTEMKRFILWTSLFVLFLLFLAVFTLYRLSRDIPPPDLSEITLTHPPVPPEENAYTYFCAVTQLVRGTPYGCPLVPSTSKLSKNAFARALTAVMPTRPSPRCSKGCVIAGVAAWSR